MYLDTITHILAQYYDQSSWYFFYSIL